MIKTDGKPTIAWAPGDCNGKCRRHAVSTTCTKHSQLARRKSA